MHILEIKSNNLETLLVSAILSNRPFNLTRIGQRLVINSLNYYHLSYVIVIVIITITLYSIKLYLSNNILIFN